jgi:hypothetical protein
MLVMRDTVLQFKIFISILKLTRVNFIKDEILTLVVNRHIMINKMII